jgi:DNA-binding MarR family transcriptional regulator
MSGICVVWEQTKSVLDNMETQIAKNLQRDHGLGITEFRALRLLAESSDSELRMQELAKQLGLNQSSVTRLVERLEKDGYTIRDLCPNDKRGVYTVLTGRGRDIQHKAAADYVQYIHNALDEVEQQMSQVTPIVATLRQLLHKNTSE